MDAPDLEVMLDGTARGQNLDARVDALLARLNAAGTPDSRNPRARRRVVAFSGLALGLAFGVGLLLGWLAIGWWLWPVQWENSRPWELTPDCQARYVALVAAEHYRSGNAAQARQDLAGWDARRLQQLLSRMERETADPAVRQQLAALRSALGIPPAEPSLWSSVLSRRPILLSTSLAALPFATALGLAVAPRAARWLCVELPEDLEVETPEADPDGLPHWLRGPVDPEQASADAGPAETADKAPLPVPREERAPGDEAAAKSTARAEASPPRSAALVHVEVSPEERDAAEEEAVTDEVLRDLLGNLGSHDSRLETLALMTEPIDVEALAEDTAQVLERLRALTAQATGEQA
jgi:hypothetical protein